MKSSTRFAIKECLCVAAIVGMIMVSCKPSHATELIVSGFSHHLTYGKYNQFNPGVGVYHELSQDTALVGGTYHNSYGRQTVYGGASSHIAGRGTIQLRVDWVLATGYQYAVIPGVVPVVEVVTSKITTRVMLIPRVSEETATAIGVQWRVKF